MQQITILHLPYTGDNLALLKEISKHFPPTEVLFRASELAETGRTLKYGTDRGGFPPKLWQDGITPYDDIVFGTTAADIEEGERDASVSTSFKKIPIIKDPIILLYDITQMEEAGYHEWRFKQPAAKLQALKAVIIL